MQDLPVTLDQATGMAQLDLPLSGVAPGEYLLDLRADWARRRGQATGGLQGRVVARRQVNEGSLVAAGGGGGGIAGRSLDKLHRPGRRLRRSAGASATARTPRRPGTARPSRPLREPATRRSATCVVRQSTSSGTPSTRRSHTCPAARGPEARSGSCCHSQRSDSISARRMSRATATCRTCRRVSTCAPRRPPARAAGVSCGHRLAADPARWSVGGRLSGLRDCDLGSGRECVKTSPRTILARGNVRVFAPAAQQPHLLQPTQRAIERPVGGQQLLIGGVTEPLGHFVPVKLLCGRGAAVVPRRDRWPVPTGPASRPCVACGQVYADGCVLTMSMYLPINGRYRPPVLFSPPVHLPLLRRRLGGLAHRPPFMLALSSWLRATLPRRTTRQQARSPARW